MRLISQVGALLFLLAAAHSPASAQATDNRVAVTELEGRAARAARRVLVRALERQGYGVVSSDTPPSDDLAARAALARELGVRALVGGRVSRRGARWRLRLWIAPAGGGAQREVRIDIRRGRGVRILGRRLGAILSEMLSEASRPVADAMMSGPQAVPEETPAATDDSTASATEQRVRTPVVGEEEPSPFRLSLLLGAGLRSRRVQLLSPDGVDAGYRAEPFFEVAGQAEAWFFNVAFVRVGFGSSVGLFSERENASGTEVETLFSWLRADGGASVLWDDMVEFGAAFGVGWDRYAMSFNELVPTAEYVHLRPALRIAVRLLGRSLVFEAEGGARFPLGVGDLQALHGTEYQVFGADGAMRLKGRLDLGFSWSLELGARRYWLNFSRPDGEVRGTDGGWHGTVYSGWEF